MATSGSLLVSVMPSRDDTHTNTESHTPGSTAESPDADYVITFDPAGERASNVVVTAVAALTDTDPAVLSPLYDVIEPDALDSLCEHAQRIDDDALHRLWFPYEGFDVCVRSDGQVRLLETPTTAGYHPEDA